MIRVSGSRGHDRFNFLENNVIYSDESQPFFGGTCRRLFQGGRLGQERNQNETGMKKYFFIVTSSLV
jgi:hypothetical protein